MIVRELTTRLGFVTDSTGAKKYDADLTRIERRAKDTGAAIIGTTAAIGTIVGNWVADIGQRIGAGIIAAGKAIPLAGDAMRQSIATINSTLEDTPEAERVYEKLYQAVRETGAGLEESAKSFAKWHLTLSEVGKSADDTVDTVTGLQAAFAATGKSKGDINSIIEQLGDALSAKKLSGDEFKSLKDSLPEFIKFLLEKLGKSSEELEKLADDQKLALDMWLDPLMEFARRGTKRLADSPLTMARAWAGLKTTAGRLAADLDKILGLSAGIARGLKGIADGLEAIRKKLPAIQDFIRGFGGLSSSIIAAGIMLALYFGPTAVALVRLLTVAVWGLARGIIVAFLPLAGIVAWFLIIEDFIGWIQGKRSLFGERFGDFEAVKAQAVAIFEEVKATILGKFEEAKERLLGWFGPIGAQLAKDAAAIGVVFSDVWAFLEAKARTFAEAMSAIGAAVRAALEAMFGPITAVIDQAKAAAEWLRSNLSGPGGAGATSDPEAQEQRRRNFQNRMQGLYPEPGATVAPAVPGPASWNAPQNNDIDIQVSVNAPGGSGAEIASWRSQRRGRRRA